MGGKAKAADNTLTVEEDLFGDIGEATEAKVQEEKAKPARTEPKTIGNGNGGPFNFKPGWPVVFDIETEPLPEDQLRATFAEKTAEEFADSCDKRWKPETVAAKYEEYKATAWAEHVKRAALSPVTGRVLAIGYGQNKLTVTDIGDEDALLRSWWNVFQWAANSQPATRLVGFNSSGFDVPFLIRRSWHHRISPPFDLFHGRYLHPVFVDLMDVWSCGNREQRISLNDLAIFLGTTGKPEGVSGADFHKLLAGTEDERKQAIAYLENDIRMTAEIASVLNF